MLTIINYLVYPGHYSMCFLFSYYGEGYRRECHSQAVTGTSRHPPRAQSDYHMSVSVIVPVCAKITQ